MVFHLARLVGRHDLSARPAVRDRPDGRRSAAAGHGGGSPFLQADRGRAVGAPAEESRAGAQVRGARPRPDCRISRRFPAGGRRGVPLPGRHRCPRLRRRAPRLLRRLPLRRQLDLRRPEIPHAGAGRGARAGGGRAELQVRRVAAQVRRHSQSRVPAALFGAQPRHPPVRRPRGLLHARADPGHAGDLSRLAAARPEAARNHGDPRRLGAARRGGDRRHGSFRALRLRGAGVSRRAPRLSRLLRAHPRALLGRGRGRAGRPGIWRPDRG